LGGKVAVAGGDAKEDSVVLLELVRGDFGNGGGFGRGVHHGEDFGREGLGDSVRSMLATGRVLNISRYSAEDSSKGREAQEKNCRSSDIRFQSAPLDVNEKASEASLNRVDLMSSPGYGWMGSL